MTYDVHLSRSAYSFLKRLEKRYRIRIIKKLNLLSKNPYVKGAKKILGRNEKLLRIRVGHYRILYEILEKEEVVLIIKIDKRSRAYK
ncbi:MAG: type II toxin-antitoxin system RelE/ParE family toxin [Methanobacteriaceae archaeon]|nr:type II toxin-antitoxin system RelE/ParE family toxin [Methanobacteriaceae archaeon]